MSINTVTSRYVTVSWISQYCGDKSVWCRFGKEFQIIVIPGESVTLFRHREAERREVETTVTIGQCAPMILCNLITQRDLVEECGGWHLWHGEQRVTTQFVKVWMLQWLLNLMHGSVLVSPRQEMRRKGDGQTNKLHADTAVSCPAQRPPPWRAPLIVQQAFEDGHLKCQPNVQLMDAKPLFFHFCESE